MPTERTSGKGRMILFSGRARRWQPRLGHHFGEGVYQFWITPADLRARRFDRVDLTADAY
jgi:hypothetical protein